MITILSNLSISKFMYHYLRLLPILWCLHKFDGIDSVQFQFKYPRLQHEIIQDYVKKGQNYLKWVIMITTLSDLSVLKFMYHYLRFLLVLWNSVAPNLLWSLVVDHSTLIWVPIHYAYKNQRWWKTSTFNSSWHQPLQRSIYAHVGALFNRTVCSPNTNAPA